MGLRFRRSFKLAPGIRMNLSGSGMSWTLGPRGASVNLGKRGTYFNAGIRGTGLSSRTRLSSSRSNSGTSSKKTTTFQAQVEVTDDGIVIFKDMNGNPLPDNYIRAAKKQNAEIIQTLIQDKCDTINKQIDALGEIHLDTPSPDNKPVYMPREFDLPEPTKPLLKKSGILGWLFGFWRERIARINAGRTAIYQNELSNWTLQHNAFVREENARKILIEQGIYQHVDAMSRYLEMNLQDIIWPRETLVAFDITAQCNTVYIDVDLPEIEDMPNRHANVLKSGYKLSVKELSSTKIQQLYMQHVHGVGFRIIGETFSCLPRIMRVVLSAYSQRIDRKTGHITDEYLYSVNVDRRGWSQINFNRLDKLDVVNALDQFDLLRKMTKTGTFKPIEPYRMTEGDGIESVS